MVLSIAIVAGFQNTTNIGFAYGAAVSAMMLLTTFFFCIVIVAVFDHHWIWALVFGAFFGLIDGTFLAANLLKFTSGAWIAVTISIVIAGVLLVWRWGRARTVAKQAEMAVPFTELFLDSNGLAPLPGKMLIYYSSVSDRVPAAFSHFLQQLPVRPATVVFTTITAVDVPFVEDEITLTPVPEHAGVYRASVVRGYFEATPDATLVAARLIRMIPGAVPKDLGEGATDEELLARVRPAFMLGRDHVACEEHASLWHRATVVMYQALCTLSRSATDVLRLPVDSAVEVGLLVRV